MQSMTGFGQGRAKNGDVEISIEVSSVNRRGLEVIFSAPKDFQVYEKQAAERVRRDISRGRVHVVMNVESTAGVSDLSWDNEAVKETLERLRELARSEGLTFKPDADALFKIAMQHRVTSEAYDTEKLQEPFERALHDAMHAFTTMREREGEALYKDLKERLETISQHVSAIDAEKDTTAPRYREILFNRLRQAGLDLDLEDERVLREIALFADRSDISEEITRLKSHVSQFAETAAAAADPVGRKLDFIAQEINREVNTIGSKANNLDISKTVLELKNELERVREQVQNVE